MAERFDVCILGLKCYGLLSASKNPRYLGGIERVLVSLARGMAAFGLRVAFITYDEGQPGKEVIDGVSVFAAHKADAGIRGLRFLHPRMTAIWAVMKRVDARCYLQMGAGVETAVVAFGARWLLPGKRPFVYVVGSDSDVMPDLPLISTSREKRLYKWGLRKAGRIVSQTGTQGRSLETNYGRSSAVISMPHKSAHAYCGPREKENGATRHLVWVGRVVEVKRLEWLLEVAERLPQIVFDVIGSANTHTEYSGSIVARARKMLNVVVHGKVSDARLDELYRGADLLCCTSIVEGFPISFIEAWSYGLPIVTTFDPDNVIATNRLGIRVDSIPGFVQAIDRLLNDPHRYSEMQRGARLYYLANYTEEVVIPKFVELLEFR